MNSPSSPSSPPSLPSDSRIQTLPTPPSLPTSLVPSRLLPPSRLSRLTPSPCTPATWPPLTLNARLSRPTLELPVPPKRPEATSTQPSISTVVRRNDHIDQLLEIKLQAE